MATQVNNREGGGIEITPIETIKSWFKTGLKPTQNQFWAWMNSFWHKDEPIPMDKIYNLPASINSKIDVDTFENHLKSENAHSALFAAKVDKVEGKQLSSNDYTDGEKAKLAELQTAESLQSFASMQEALQMLGAGKYFLWSENNTDGVVSPFGSVVGVTKEK